MPSGGASASSRSTRASRVARTSSSARNSQRSFPGILAWAVRGCLAWQLDDLGQAGAVARATTAYRADEDTLGSFIDEQCTLDGEVAAPALRAAYEAYCAELDEPALGAKALGKRLSRRGITADRRGQGRRVYLGISLKPEVTSAMSDVTFGNSPLAPAREGLSDSNDTKRHTSPGKDQR